MIHSSPQRCHHCVHNASSNCDRLTAAPVLCPLGEPYCATVARTPNFTSSLTCAAAKDPPCLLTFNSKLELEMSCICNEQLCNAPYSAQLRNELLNFSHRALPNATELTETFLKSSVFANVTSTDLYKVITEVRATEGPVFAAQSTTIALASIANSEIGPRAEALKHEATVPPDDDEDEGEGSGSFEEARTHASPAAPSSYLPAEENKSATLVFNVYLLVFSVFQLHEIL
ncbi:uncharacterized protein LOC112054933 isoform X2 [Bicyclus anynana]|uniref:Uncharacterized protein LOC112054933 isoform X2 n=1 Tax=Bicyclus anynana TaxID=110368 RepID=A0ABM3LZ42_BICAN|nr:uncharacterized protein LOC112054933 isoform X2 [Bicyclus anynana]